jgi:site-specific DNA-methyltransferase (adenine-specific)
MRNYQTVEGDCMEWLKDRDADSVQAVCTDPPYGMIEFSAKEIGKLRSGKGGIWRLPPNINGCKRDPLPRFTVLTDKEKDALEEYFFAWGTLLARVVVPGAHVLVAGNSYLQHYVQRAMHRAGFEVRGAIVRVYQGFRGGDRPKNAEKEFPDVCVTVKGYYEPWMLFRRPISENTVAANLRKWNTGGLRMLSGGRPFPEVIMSGRTPKREEEIAPHPCLKPQHLMRILTRMLLPMGKGVILDPFMGAGSTIAAAERVGYHAIGIELDKEYFETARHAVPLLTALYPKFTGDTLEFPNVTEQSGYEEPAQLVLAIAEGSAKYGRR